MCADSSRVKANVHSHQLPRSGLTAAGFREQAFDEKGLFVLSESGVDENGFGPEETRYYQDCRGQRASVSTGLYASWRTSRSSKSPELNYQGNAIADGNGFILSRGVAHASKEGWKALPHLPDQLPLQPESLAADTACNAGQLGRTLEERSIAAFIPNSFQAGIEHGGQGRL